MDLPWPLIRIIMAIMSKLKSPFSKETYEKNAQIYRLLANPKRLEILNIIKHHEANVTELSDMLKMRKANISQHLAVLRHVRVVNVRRDGQKVYYKIANARIIEPCRVFKELREKRQLM